jgi:BirA family transcriptional regulator, biotin operon repressor / biotin---[acetyl-CoA-carboxylase] ligase
MAWQLLPLTDPGVADTGRWSVWYVPETGSTNADLLGLADAPDRTVLVTGHQTAGRGRLDRTWDAPPGVNLLTSILFTDVPEQPGDLTRAVGIAAVDAVAATTGRGARLKWPNDVLLDDRKLAGILAQRAPSGPVVVGIGLNVGWAPEGAASLGNGIEPTAVLTELLRAFDASIADRHDRYRTLLDTLGRQVRVELPSGDIVGRAVDVDRDGSLMVIDECAITHHVDAGDVVHLRPV